MTTTTTTPEIVVESKEEITEHHVYLRLAAAEPIDLKTGGRAMPFAVRATWRPDDEDGLICTSIFVKGREMRGDEVTPYHRGRYFHYHSCPGWIHTLVADHRPTP